MERARAGSLRIQNSDFKLQTSESMVGESQGRQPQNSEFRIQNSVDFTCKILAECRIQEGRIHPEFYILKPVRSHLQNADSSPFRIQNSCFQNSDEFCKVP